MKKSSNTSLRRVVCASWCDSEILPSLLAVSSWFLLSIKVLHVFSELTIAPVLTSDASLSHPPPPFISPSLSVFLSLLDPLPVCSCSMPLCLFICGSFYLSFSLIIYFHLRFSFLTSCILSVWHSCWLPNYLVFHKHTHSKSTHKFTHVLSLSHRLLWQVIVYNQS